MTKDSNIKSLISGIRKERSKVNVGYVFVPYLPISTVSEINVTVNFTSSCSKFYEKKINSKNYKTININK